MTPPSHRERLTRFQRTATILGVVGIVATLILIPFGGGIEGFYQSYLYGFLFWLGLSLGCLVILMIQHLAGGPWGAMIRRPLEAGTMNLIVMAVLFIPVLLGLGSLYEWTDPEYVATHPVVQAKELYLNVPAFIVRAAVYFATWIILALLFWRWAKRQDEGRAEALAQHMRNAGALGIILYILTMTFAAFDWGMSLTPDWFSGMYGVILMIGQAISAVSFMIILMTLFWGTPPLSQVLDEKRLQDLGNFLMAFTMFWAYIQASQLIITWSNNTVETSTWYVTRLGPGWGWVGGFLLVFHFFVPFAILFSRWVKRKARALVWVALWMMLMRLVDLFWIIIPTYGREGFPLRLLDVAVVVGLGGIWLAFFFARLKNLSLLPTNDPRIQLHSEAAAHD